MNLFFLGGLGVLAVQFRFYGKRFN
jgi:hypothetical protein